MTQAMTVPQLMEWKAFFRDEPLPERRADWRAAQVAATFRNVMVALWARNAHPKQVSDFLLQFRRPQPQNPAAIFGMVKSYFMIQGALVDERGTS